jgi:hypothetical protein
MHGLLHLLKGARLDLSDPLARDAKLDCKLVQCERRLVEPAALEDVAFAVVEDPERHAKRAPAGLRLLAFRETRFLIGSFVCKPILPREGIAILC